MPDWLTIVIAVVGLLGTILGVLGVSGYLGERARHKAERRNRREDQTEEQIRAAEEARLHDTIRNALKEETKPIAAKLDNITAEIADIKEDLANNTIGTVTILRDRMKAILDDCREAGYATTSTKANWRELYHTYSQLGGNHFREYVDAWKEEIEDLPGTAPVGKGRKVSRSAPRQIDMLGAKFPLDDVELPEEVKELVSTKK